ncbi:ATP phosphoribosyltransferase regulatory subunit [Selenomonadales bacterium OttesenSCG-928-I06]|nr:ATP phosphoribosyltransferase regulatory subunit [Selenomonadales bacterium OttesenSCG-928-I06]
MTHNFLPKIPYGTSDLLPREASEKRNIEASLAKLFRSWGYEELVSPTFEFLETFTAGSSNDMSQYSFKFFDKDNRVLVLRPDMTTPIARIVSTRLKDSKFPMRFFYLSNVFRHEQAQTGRKCEFYQAGIELLGSDDHSSDAEVVALAAESLLNLKLTNFQIGLGQIEFIKGVMLESGLPKIISAKIEQLLVNRDIVGIEQTLDNVGFHHGLFKLLKEILELHGKESVLEKAYNLVQNDLSRKALYNLAGIHTLLKAYKLEEYINFDLSIIRDFDYYTGMTMEAYTPGLGFPVLGGGRYNNLTQSFGFNCPATGFALGIERVILALFRQGLTPLTQKKDVYIAWKKGKLPDAILAAKEYRKSNLTVEVALAEQTKEEAFEISKNFKEFIYLE